MSIKYQDILLEKGIRPSIIRLKVYEYLASSNIHPTVDEIYHDLHQMIPTLSKTTIYNILSLFVEKNLVKSLNVDSIEARYESIKHDHSHFKCNNCGELYDIPNQLVNLINDDLSGFVVESKEVLFKGLCPKCK